METKENMVGPPATSVRSTVDRCMVSRSAACVLFITCLYRLSPARFRYVNGFYICSKLLKLDIVIELKLMCSYEQDTIQIVLQDKSDVHRAVHRNIFL
jgi:hypothetical protein